VAKTYIRGQFTYLNVQPSNRPIKAGNAVSCTVRMHLRLPTMWKELFATPDRTFIHQCWRQEDGHSWSLQGNQLENGRHVPMPLTCAKQNLVLSDSWSRFKVQIKSFLFSTPIRPVLSSAHRVFQSVSSLQPYRALRDFTTIRGFKVGMTYQETRRMLVSSEEKRPVIIRRFRRARLVRSQLASKPGPLPRWAQISLARPSRTQ